MSNLVHSVRAKTKHCTQLLYQKTIYSSNYYCAGIEAGAGADSVGAEAAGAEVGEEAGAGVVVSVEADGAEVFCPELETGAKPTVVLVFWLDSRVVEFVWVVGAEAAPSVDVD